MKVMGQTLRRVTLPILVLLCSSMDGLASQIVLKNGDRITGAVTASANDGLTIHSALIGDVQIPWNAVERASIEENVSVPSGFRNGVRRAARPPAPDPVKTPVNRSPLDGSLRTFDLLRHWSGSIDPGFTWTQGNANSRTLNIAVNAARTVGSQKVSFSMNWLHTNNLDSGRTLTTAKAVRSGTRYDYNLKESLFVFGSGNWEYDRFQELDLRNVLGSGVGWHAVRRKTFHMDFLSGGNFNRESFRGGLKRNFIEAVADQEANYRPNDHLVLRGHFTLIPNLTQPGQYRAAVEATAVTSVTKYLGWQITLTDRYTSLHAPTVKPNDMVVTAGLRFAFTR